MIRLAKEVRRVTLSRLFECPGAVSTKLRLTSDGYPCLLGREIIEKLRELPTGEGPMMETSPTFLRLVTTLLTSTRALTDPEPKVVLEPIIAPHQPWSDGDEPLATLGCFRTMMDPYTIEGFWNEIGINRTEVPQ